MIHVFIADDHPIVRRGLEDIINDEPEFVLDGQADNGEDALRMLRKQAFDVAVLDISMPKMNGLEILQKLRDENNGVRVLILSMHEEDKFAIRALRSGAQGYLTKVRAAEELVEAIRRISEGKRYVTSSLGESLAHLVIAGGNIPEHERLSEREFAVLIRISQGMKISEIAKNLHLSPKTVSTYRTRILEKLDLSSNAALTRYAIEENLIE